MSVRPIVIALVLAWVALALAAPAQATVVCEAVDTPLLHVGVAADADGPCRQDCPSTINVNVAVSINGDIEQCSGSASLLNSQANAPLCGPWQGPTQTDCERTGLGAWEFLECLLSPNLAICRLGGIEGP